MGSHQKGVSQGELTPCYKQYEDHRPLENNSSRENQLHAKTIHGVATPQYEKQMPLVKYLNSNPMRQFLNMFGCQKLWSAVAWGGKLMQLIPSPSRQLSTGILKGQSQKILC